MKLLSFTDNFFFILVKEMSCVRLLMLLLTGNQQYSKWSASFLSLQRTHLTDRDKAECTLPVTIYDFSNCKTRAAGSYYFGPCFEGRWGYCSKKMIMCLFFLIAFHQLSVHIYFRSWVWISEWLLSWRKPVRYTDSIAVLTAKFNLQVWHKRHLDFSVEQRRR